MNISEMKHAAADIKRLKPVQAAIMTFFQMKSWKEVQQALGEDVSPERLSRYTVCNFLIVMKLCTCCHAQLHTLFYYFIGT